jgi:hypothetical protein
MVPIKIHLFTSNFKQHQQGQKWFRKSMEKNKYEAKYYLLLYKELPF